MDMLSFARCRHAVRPHVLRRRSGGQALVELAIVLPLLLFLIVGGMSLFVRNLYRSAVDEAAEQAAWAAARTGGDSGAVQAVIQRSIPFVSLDELDVSVASTGYHDEVAVTVVYRGTAITSLPFFNSPLPPAQASATNQQEVAFAFRLGGSAPSISAAGASPDPSLTPLAPVSLDPAQKDTPKHLGPAEWPAGPAVLPSSGASP